MGTIVPPLGGRLRISQSPLAADNHEHMAVFTVECLRCGEQREVVSTASSRLRRGECPRCGYVGWADSSALTEPARRALRERPLDVRRSRLPALPRGRRVVAL